MELQKFIINFAELFEETDTNDFKAETAFKELDEWSSLHALLIIAMADEKYGVKITGEDIRNSTTINDVYEIVKNRK
jgi:acyl carrier protein